ncbi:rRNA methyltransferase 3, mitochondrial [Armadillidium nasatum]|uniref:rRNA methyltransferase 3, mitochondrial n=1 Tax=Armadillidium nasatum TaxID=96803 RepID=A0A5N5TIS1_9CRUS|nr:rRNA methyltransferase 3, mitochondrial [Armadillidium nasatum]
MNCIPFLPLKSYTLMSQHLKSFYKVSFRLSTSLSLVHNQHGNSKLQLLPVPTTIQKTQIRSKYLRRTPIDVIENTKGGQYMENWAEEQLLQTGQLYNDETELPTEKDDRDTLADEEEVTKPKKKKKRDKKTKKALKEEEKSQNWEEMKKKDLVFKELNVQLYHKALPKVRTYLEEGKSAYVREELDFFYVEGWRLVGEALNKGLKPLAIFFSRSRLFYNLIPSVAKTDKELASMLNLYPLYKTPYTVFKLWSSLKTPPGIIGVFQLSEAERVSTPTKLKSELSFPLTVILDEVRDPSNLGGIYRTLVAAGVEQIILMKGCCDIWDPKVFRATAGTQLNMNCLTKVPWKLLESHIPPTPNVFLADSYCTRDFIEAQDEELVNIEPANEEETLALKKEGLAVSEKSTVIETTEDGNELEVNYSHDDEYHLQMFKNIEFPKVSYEDADFFTESLKLDGQNTILIIGGEKGLSNNAKKFALESNAVQVGVPLLNDVESLNSSVATGILVYAAQKQYKDIKRKQKAQDIGINT